MPIVRLQRPEGVALGPRPDRQTGELGLPLTKSYNQHWTLHQAVDEYVQNWIDQIEKCGKANSSFGEAVKRTLPGSIQIGMKMAATRSVGLQQS